MPSNRPTRSEYAVLFVGASGGLMILEYSVLVMSSRASSMHPAAAAALAVKGWWCLGIGAGLGLAFWAFRQLMD